MIEMYPIFVYFTLVFAITLLTVGVSYVFPAAKTSSAKYMPYESGIRTETHLLKERFPMHHYLVALMFLVFDVEIIFLYPWAVVAKQIGPFAFYEMLFFLVTLVIGFAYIWRKGGLQWD